MKKLYSVQYLRGIAALLVVYCHAIDLQELFGVSAQQRFLYLENFGAIGVDIFFVISGFIISYIARSDTGREAAADFMKRRLIRVVPAYYIASLLMLGMAMLGKHFIFPSKELIKTLTILPLFDSGPALWGPLITLGWTLGFEFFFYLLYALLIALAAVKKDTLLVLVITLLCILGRIFPAEQLQWRFFTNPMMLEFVFGVMIAMVYKSQKNIAPALCSLLILFALVSYAALVIRGFGRISEAEEILANRFVPQRILLWGLPSAMLAAGLIWIEKNGKAFSRPNKLLAFLGDASYSIYLAHPLCYALAGAVLKRMPVLTRLSGDVLILLLAVSAVISGILFHLYIERPVIRALNMRLLKPKSNPV